MTDQSDKTKEQPQQKEPARPAKYQPVPLDPLDQSAPGEHKVLRKENRKRVLGESETAKGLDFDPFQT